MSKPSKKDGEIIIQLASLGTSMNTGDGSAIIWSAGFDGSPEKYPAGTEEHGKILDFMRWMETIATLYRNGVVNEDLLFDWIGITGSWDKVKPIALAIRAETMPAMWENFEYMAEKQRNWKPKRERKAVADGPASVRKTPRAEKVAAGKGAENGTS